jgi:hypothetical protein
MSYDFEQCDTETRQRISGLRALVMMEHKAHPELELAQGIYWSEGSSQCCPVALIAHEGVLEHIEDCEEDSCEICETGMYGFSGMLGEVRKRVDINGYQLTAFISGWDWYPKPYQLPAPSTWAGPINEAHTPFFVLGYELAGELLIGDDYDTRT